MSRFEPQSANTARDRTNVAAIVPLLPQQDAMLLYCGEPGPGDLGFLPVRFDLVGDLDRETWYRAWDDVVARHDALRMTLETPRGQRPMAVVWRTLQVPIDYEDLSGLTPPEQRRRLDEHANASLRQGIALDDLPTFRIATFDLGGGRHRVHWDCHHLLLDGWSSTIVVRDLVAAYHARRGSGPEPVPITTSYPEIHRALRAEPSRAAQRHWSEALRDLPVPRRLASRPRPVSETRVESVSIALNGHQTKAIDRAIREARTTAGAAVRAAWALTLGAAQECDDVVFGTVVSGRPSELAGVELVTGFFSNVVPARVRVPRERRVGAWLRDLRDATLSSQAHESLSLKQILDIAGLDEVPFESLVLVQNLPTAPDDGAALQIESYHSVATSAYPLTLIVSPGPTWRVSARFDRRLLEPRHVHELVERAGEVLCRMPGALGQAVGAFADGLGPLKLDLPVALDRPLAGAPAAHLAATTLAESKVVDGYRPPTSGCELALVELWQSVLDVSPIGVDDHFFDLGGSSISAVEMFTEIERRFDTLIPLATLLERPTIAELAELIDDGEPEELSCVVPIRTHEGAPRLFCVHAGGGHVLFYRELALAIGDAASVYGLQPVGIDGRERPLDTIEAIATRYLAEMRRVQPDGPYHLLGYCFGAAVVFEMAHQLRATGEPEPSVVLVDSSAPRPRRRSLPERLVDGIKRHLPLRRRHIVRALTRDTARRREIDMEILQGLCEDAFLRYQPSPYTGRMLFLQGGESEEWERPYWGTGFLEDWYAIAPDLEVLRFDCDHDRFFVEPHVRDTAAAVVASISR